MTELARSDGGIPAAAVEMGISPRAISALVNGDVPSAAELDAIYAWLTRRTMLSSRQAEDYEELRANPGRHTGEQPDKVRGEVRRSSAANRAALPSARGIASIVATIVVTAIVTVAITVVVVKSGGNGNSEADAKPSGKRSAQASPSISRHSPAATASRTSSPSPDASPSETTTAGAEGSSTYASSEPFPLCDSSGGLWKLINLNPGPCGQDMQPNASTGYSFGTLSAIPRGIPLTASNTVTVTGVIPGDPDKQLYCLGAAEGSAASGYVGLICSDGNWYLDAVTGLGTSTPVVGKQLYTGTFSYEAATSYDISLTFGSGTGKLAITLTQGSNSPITRSFGTGQFTPVAVGYALDNEADLFGGGNGSQIGEFTYAAG